MAVHRAAKTSRGRGPTCRRAREVIEVEAVAVAAIARLTVT